MNLYENEVIAFISNQMELRLMKKNEDAYFFFKKLMNAFPYVGSKIDWEKISNHLCEINHDSNELSSKVVEFFLMVKNKFSLEGNVIYVGDSATDFALVGSIDDVIKILPNLLEIPQHHYFVHEDFSWCFCFTLEGDMDFGFSQSN